MTTSRAPKQTLVVLALAVLLPAGAVSVQGQTGSNETSLRAVHQLLTQAVTSGDISMVENLVHPRAIGFFRDSQQLVQLRSGYGPAEVLPAVLADLRRFSSITYDATFRVVGDAAIVAMTSTDQSEDWKVENRYLRSTYLYVREQDNWKLLSWHTSDTPLAK